MEKKIIFKGLFVVVLVLGAFGLLAGEPGRELTIAFPERGNAPQAPDSAGGPRECDVQRGIETLCIYL